MTLPVEIEGHAHDLLRQSLSRRNFLQLGGATAGVGLLLAGCGFRSSPVAGAAPLVIEQVSPGEFVEQPTMIFLTAGRYTGHVLVAYRWTAHGRDNKGVGVIRMAIVDPTRNAVTVAPFTAYTDPDGWDTRACHLNVLADGRVLLVYTVDPPALGNPSGLTLGADGRVGNTRYFVLPAGDDPTVWRNWGAYTTVVTGFGGSTTIASGSSGAALPQTTVHVASVPASAPESGRFVVSVGGPGASPQVVTYKGRTATAFTGCTGGAGTLAAGMLVSSGFDSPGYSNAIEPVTGTLMLPVVGANGVNVWDNSETVGYIIGTYRAAGPITWGSFVPVAAVAGHTTGECSLAIAANGTAVFLWRDSAASQVYYSTMTAATANGLLIGGGTWEPPAVLPDVGTLCYAQPAVVALPSGALAFPTRLSSTQESGAIATSLDDGVTWALQQIDSPTASDGYNYGQIVPHPTIPRLSALVYSPAIGLSTAIAFRWLAEGARVKPPGGARASPLAATG